MGLVRVEEKTLNGPKGIQMPMGHNRIMIVVGFEPMPFRTKPKFGTLDHSTKLLSEYNIT